MSDDFYVLVVGEVSVFSFALQEMGGVMRYRLSRMSDRLMSMAIWSSTTATCVYRASTCITDVQPTIRCYSG